MDAVAVLSVIFVGVAMLRWPTAIARYDAILRALSVVYGYFDDRRAARVIFETRRGWRGSSKQEKR